MRESGKTTLIEENGVTVGIVLSGGGCAEHEWGIAGILTALHIPSPKFPIGLGDRTMKEPGSYVFGVMNHRARVGRKQINVSIARLSVARFALPETLMVEKPRIGSEDYALLTSRWDTEGFLIEARGENERAFLNDLRVAISVGDVAVWWGRLTGNPFDYPGLVIAIASRVPAARREEMETADKEHRRLEEAADATGIRQRIADKQNGEWRSPYRYYALKPSWAASVHTVLRGDHSTEIKTAYPVVFFLNPSQQDKQNSGWFTVEELDDWIAGKGPVLRTRIAA